MPIYVALFRGINISGQKLIKMEALRGSLEAAGFGGVRTYIQSGNVVFSAPASLKAEDLSGKIEKTVLRDFGFSAPVMLRSAEELQKAARRNPFLKERGIDRARLFVSFLAGVPPAAAKKALAAAPLGKDRFHHAGREIYLHLPDGAGNARLNHDMLERKLGVRATTRNWNTVTKLCEMCEEEPA